MNHISANRMADILGISAPTYKRLEEGELLARVSPNYSALARLLDVSENVLTDDSKSFSNPPIINVDKMTATSDSDPESATTPTGKLENESQSEWRRFLHRLSGEYGGNAQLAQAIGIDAPHLSRLLGSSRITRTMMFRIAKALNRYDWYKPLLTDNEGEQLREYLDYIQMENQKLGDLLGIKKSGVSGILKQPSLSSKMWAKLVTALGVPKEVILQGGSPGLSRIKPAASNDPYVPVEQRSINPQIKPYIEDEDEMIEIPMLPESARAGLDAERYFEQPVETVRVPVKELPMNLRKRRWWQIRVNGDSMEPQLQAGDVVLAYWLDTSEWDKVHNRVAIIQHANQVVIKRIKNNRLLTDGGLWLHSDNPRAETFFVPVGDIQHIWLVARRSGNIH